MIPGFKTVAWALSSSAIALFCLAGCAPPPPKASSESSPAKVKMVTLKAQNQTPSVDSFGSLAFAHKADVSAVVEGTLLQAVPEEGHWVRSNEVLCTLENIQITIQGRQAQHEVSAARAGVETAQAKLWQAKIQLEARRLSLTKTSNQLKQKKREYEETEKTLRGKETLFDLSGVSQQDLDALKLKLSADKTDLESLKTDYETQQIGLRDADIVAFGLAVPRTEEGRTQLLQKINTTVEQAEVDSAQANLEKALGDVEAAALLAKELTILSPLNGVVGARYVELGEHVTPGTKIATIFDDSTIDAVVPVSEDEGLKLQNGMAAAIWIDALGPQSFSGRIENISPLVDPTSGHFTVKVRLNHKDRRFKPGLFARVTIPYGAAVPILVLPQSALIEKHADEGRVFLVVNRRLVERHVVLGKEQEGGWQIISGLRNGDTVVDEPSPLQREGDRVEPAA